MKIATFNVNSVRARLENLLDWLREADPDIVLLQEIKCQEEAFPEAELKAAGYYSAVYGQKSYNGVAILSKQQVHGLGRGLPGGESDDQARYLEAVCGDVRVASVYAPNGNPADSEKYPYKLAWLDRLTAHVRDRLLPLEQPFVLGGDYNVCPDDRDVYDPQGWAGDALCRPESRAAFRRLLNLGLTEAWRVLHPDASGHYSYWDYVKGRWPRDEGLRIDHFLLSPQAADRLVSCEIDKKPRGREKASDHTPVICQLRG